MPAPRLSLLPGLLCACSLVAAPAPPPATTVEVVIALRDLYPGVPIGPDDVAERAVFAADVERETTFVAPEEVLGRTPRERILANEAVREERRARPDAGLGLNALLTPGKRALTLTLPGASLIQPGYNVDLSVLGTAACPFSGRKLQAVRVLAVEGEMLPPGAEAATTRKHQGSNSTASATAAGSDSRHLTLEVTPYEASVLEIASLHGTILVELRSDVDVLQAPFADATAPPCLPLPASEAGTADE